MNTVHKEWITERHSTTSFITYTQCQCWDKQVFFSKAILFLTHFIGRVRFFFREKLQLSTDVYIPPFGQPVGFVSCSSGFI